MERRKAVQAITLLMGRALSASTLSILPDRCSQDPRSTTGTISTSGEHTMISRVADISIPRTDRPGAVDAGVPAFIVPMMQGCYPPKDQQAFHTGPAAFDHLCRKKFRASFLKLSAGHQGHAVKYPDKALPGKNTGTRQGQENLSFYQDMKALTMPVFFTSGPATSQTLHYVQIPGRYDGFIPFRKEDKAWAT